MDNTVFIVSYKNNNEWNPILLKSELRFKTNGFKVKKIAGYNLKNNPNIKRYEVVYLNLLNKVIPTLEKSKINTDGFFIAEDDAYLSDNIDYNYLKDRIVKIKNYKDKIIRIGYQKILKHMNSKYVVGTQLIWIPIKQISKIKTIMGNTKPQHLDGFLSKLKGIPIVLLDSNIQIKNKKLYVKEIEHHSSILGKIRHGIKLL